MLITKTKTINLNSLIQLKSGLNHATKNHLPFPILNVKKIRPNIQSYRLGKGLKS